MFRLAAPGALVDKQRVSRVLFLEFAIGTVLTACRHIDPFEVEQVVTLRFVIVCGAFSIPGWSVDCCGERIPEAVVVEVSHISATLLRNNPIRAFHV